MLGAQPCFFAAPRAGVPKFHRIAMGSRRSSLVTSLVALSEPEARPGFAAFVAAIISLARSFPGLGCTPTCSASGVALPAFFNCEHALSPALSSNYALHLTLTSLRSFAQVSLVVRTQNPPCCASHSRYLSISKGCKSVHPMGQPINHSTHCGFRRPPATTFSGSLLRRVWLGAALFFASCTVGVGNLCTALANIKSPLLPRWFGPPFVPSVALGVGHCATAVRKSIPPVPCNPAPFASLARGVGHFFTAPANPFRGLFSSKSPRFCASLARGVGHVVIAALSGMPPWA